jgi:hypothetical protein
MPWKILVHSTGTARYTANDINDSLSIVSRHEDFENPAIMGYNATNEQVLCGVHRTMHAASSAPWLSLDGIRLAVI